MANDENDVALVKETEEALGAAWDKYDAAPPGDRLLIFPQVNMAAQNWLAVRGRLLKPGTLSTAVDVAEARALRGQIENAASQQALLMSLVRLVSLLAKFA